MIFKVPMYRIPYEKYRSKVYTDKANKKLRRIALIRKIKGFIVLLLIISAFVAAGWFGKVYYG